MTDEILQVSGRARLGAWLSLAGVAWRTSPWRATVSAGLIVVNQLTNLAFAVAYGLITAGIAAGRASTAQRGLVLLGAIYAWMALGGWLAFQNRMHLREKLRHRFDLELIDLAASFGGLEPFERPDVADRLDLVRENRGQLAGSFDQACWSAASIVSVVASLGALAVLDGVLLLVPVLGLPSIWISQRSNAREQRTMQRLTPMMRMFRLLFGIAMRPSAAPEIRVFGLTPALTEHHRQASVVFEREWDRSSVRTMVEELAGRLLFTAGFVGAVGVLIRSLAEGRTTVAETVIALSLASTAQSTVAEAAGLVGWVRTTFDVAVRYAWLRRYAHEAEVHDRIDDPAPVPRRLDDGIRFEGVSFRYPGTDVDVLTDVDLHLPAGSIVAIVGDNGAGKSTLVKLLARFYEPTTGTITVDGTPLHRMPRNEWRGALSAGFQDFAKFELTAGRSIGLGHLPHLDSVEAHERALGAAAAERLADTLPDGLDTQLGRQFADGHELSGGQWQQIALGRAMMRPAPVLLLLDEPTAALDAEIEHALFDRYAEGGRAARERTGAITVLVSHRFSTVRSADLIVVVDRRRVAEVGSHDELMAHQGTYAELFALQAASYR